MPQIILECTQNILEQNLSPLLLEIHKILTENLPTQMTSCKSRVLRHAEYVVADGAPEKAFVHLSIGVLPGRTTELLNTVAVILMEKLKTVFQQSLKELDLQITIAIQDLPVVYHKYTPQF